MSYFRYFRFWPDGSFAYRTSPSILSRIAKGMAAAGGGNARERRGTDKHGTIMFGRYMQKASARASGEGERIGAGRPYGVRAFTTRLMKVVAARRGWPGCGLSVAFPATAAARAGLQGVLCAAVPQLHVRHGRHSLPCSHAAPGAPDPLCRR